MTLKVKKQILIKSWEDVNFYPYSYVECRSGWKNEDSKLDPQSHNAVKGKQTM